MITKLCMRHYSDVIIWHYWFLTCIKYIVYSCHVVSTMFTKFWINVDLNSSINFKVTNERYVFSFVCCCCCCVLRMLRYATLLLSHNPSFASALSFVVLYCEFSFCCSLFRRICLLQKLGFCVYASRCIML